MNFEAYTPDVARLESRVYRLYVQWNKTGRTNEAKLLETFEQLAGVSMRLEDVRQEVGALLQVLGIENTGPGAIREARRIIELVIVPILDEVKAKMAERAAEQEGASDGH